MITPRTWLAVPRIGKPRSHAEPKVGDRFGDWRVVRVIGRGHRGRSDLRLELVCVCGARTETYEFNARNLGACRGAKHRRGGRS